MQASVEPRNYSQIPAIPAGSFIAKLGKQYEIVAQSVTDAGEVATQHVFAISRLGRPSGVSRKAFATEVAQYLGLQILKPSRTPIAIEAKRQRNQLKRAAKAKAAAELLAEAEAALPIWIDQFSTHDIGVVELVRYCNRFAKRYPKFKERSLSQDAIVDAIYDLKDEWIKLNESRCVRHCRSASFVNTYIDWDQLNCMKDLTGEYQEPEDFERVEVTNFYAYTFDVDSVEFRFHSKHRLFAIDDKTPVQEDAHGATSPLADNEISHPIELALKMLRLAIDGSAKQLEGVAGHD